MVTQVGVARASKRQHTEKTPGNERGASADWKFDKLLEENPGPAKLFIMGTMTPEIMCLDLQIDIGDVQMTPFGDYGVQSAASGCSVRYIQSFCIKL